MKTKAKSKKAQWLNKYSESIDLDPFFQRGTVWSKAKQQYFVDSLLKDWGSLAKATEILEEVIG
jgi:hypothetical protein